MISFVPSKRAQTSERLSPPPSSQIQPLPKTHIIISPTTMPAPTKSALSRFLFFTNHFWKYCICAKRYRILPVKCPKSKNTSAGVASSPELLTLFYHHSSWCLDPSSSKITKTTTSCFLPFSPPILHLHTLFLLSSTSFRRDLIHR